MSDPDPVPVLKDYQASDFEEFLRRYLRGDTACVCEWDPGLGKTLLSILLARTMAMPRMLVVCPMIALTSWESELKKWWPSTNTLILTKGSDINRLRQTHRVVVASVDLIGRNDEVRLRLRDWARGGFGVVDEAQYLRGSATKRTGGSYGRGEGVLAFTSRVLLMSGTLIVSWPDDLWTHLARWMPERITQDGTRMTYEQFRDYFLLTRRVPIPGAFTSRIQIYGALPERVEELKTRLDGWSLKRTKAEANLPPLTWRTLELDLSPADRKSIETELMDHLPSRLQRLARAATPGDEEAGLRFAEALSEYEELWSVAMRLLGVGKAKALARILKDRLANTPQSHGIGIFSLNHRVMDVFDTELKAFGVLRVDGNTPHKSRAEAVARFQDARGPRVFSGQISACGTALTLTRGNTCYFPQMATIPGENQQAASRFHRIGQHNPVDAWIAIARGTLDQPLMGLLRKKTRVAAALAAS